MKQLTIILVMLLTGFSSMAQYREASLQASGLTCALCSNAINSALKELSFISEVDTDLENSAFTMKFRENATINFDAIRNAVEDAGFSVSSFKVLADMPQTKVVKDTHIQLGGLNLHFMDVQNKELKGATWLSVVDKNFVSTTAFRKYSKSTSMTCYQTGKMESCCSLGKKSQSTRIYHVTL